MQDREHDITEKYGDWWKWIPYLRHQASVDLINGQHDRSLHQEYSPLLPGEARIIKEKRFILPFPNPDDIPEIVTNRVTIEPGFDIPLGPITKNPDHLKWFEPSIHYYWSHITPQLEIPERTVGFTSGRWRIITAAHMDSLWQVRQNCDFMTVAVDPVDFSGYVKNDGFSPKFLDKVSFLRAITFPNGSKIDLIVATHVFDPTTNKKCVYLPYFLKEGLFSMDLESVNLILGTFKDPAKWKLRDIRKSVSDKTKDWLSRVKYFVSSGDSYYYQKELLASCVGIKVCPLRSTKEKQSIHVSQLVEKFGLNRK